LKESWKEAPQAIEELENEGEVLVTRTAKDGQLRMVFWNEIKPTEDAGGMQVEKGVCILNHGYDFVMLTIVHRISRSMAYAEGSE